MFMLKAKPNWDKTIKNTPVFRPLFPALFFEKPVSLFIVICDGNQSWDYCLRNLIFSLSQCYGLVNDQILSMALF